MPFGSFILTWSEVMIPLAWNYWDSNYLALRLAWQPRVIQLSHHSSNACLVSIFLHVCYDSSAVCVEKWWVYHGLEVQTSMNTEWGPDFKILQNPLLLELLLIIEGKAQLWIWPNKCLHPSCFFLCNKFLMK